MFAEGFEVACDLHTQFTGWAQHEGLYMFLAAINFVQHREAKGSGFTGTGLGKSYKVGRTFK
jgi:hypothetical protein